MQIQSFPQTLRLDFASEPQRRSLIGRLVQGQTLEARVLGQTPEGRWAVRFMGHTLVAESRLSLVPGQLVETRVESLGPPLVLSLSGRARSEGAALGHALRSLALADDAVNRAVVRGLIARGLPVTREDVQALRELLLGLSGAVDLADMDALEEAVSRALFLRGQGLPVTPDTLAAILSHLPPGALGGLVEGLAAFMRALRLPTRAEVDLADLAGRLRAAIPEAGVLTGDSLRRLLDELGLDLEGKLAAWVASGREGVPDGLDRTLKLALLRLMSSLQAHDPDLLDTESRRAMGALQERIGETLRFLDTLQASNLPSAARESLSLQIPLLFNGQMTTADLRIFYREEGGRRRIDPDNVRVSLSLDLTGLGPLRIDLSAVDRRAVCRIHAADEGRAAFLQGAADELKAGLERCGYAVSDITCRILEDAEGDDTRGVPTVGLDLRV